jgi:WD40 repeat protein
MSPPEVHHLFHHPIIDHSFSADRRTLAVARENNIELHVRSGSGFQLKDELRGHDKTVTGVDIAPNTGKIVTCSQGKLFAVDRRVESLLTANPQTETLTCGNLHPTAGSLP